MVDAADAATICGGGRGRLESARAGMEEFNDDPYVPAEAPVSGAAPSSAKKGKPVSSKVKPKEPFANTNTGLKFSNILPSINLLNGKNVAGNFARSDKQCWWDKRLNDDDYDRQRADKRRRLNGTEHGDEHSDTSEMTDLRGSSRVIVVHPGSRWLRIGRASDDEPVCVPNCIARRTSTLIRPEPSFAELAHGLEPQLDAKIEALRNDLRARYRAYRLRPQSDGTAQAKVHNEQAAVEEVQEDPETERLAWTETAKAAPKAAFIGEAALRIREPASEGWTIRWPIEKGNFNTRGYSSVNELLGDIAEIWLFALINALGIQRSDFKDYSIVFLMSDLYDQTYLAEMAHLALVTLDFRQICFQQESLCTTLGAGVSTACVVDMGARKTSIACVEDGMILPETRICLDMGGDDMTELLYQLLLRIAFPYRDANLNRTYDWILFESLKESVCVLSEGDVALNVYHFDVRRPGQPLLKSSVRLFDEIIVAPLALFAPRVIDFDRKQRPMPRLGTAPGDVDEVLELGSNAITQAMRTAAGPLVAQSATQHPSDEDQASPSLSQGAATAGVSASGSDPLTANIASFSARIPLDIATFESLCTLGAEDKIKRQVNSLVLCGGSAKIHNAAFALQSRLAVLFSQRYPNLVNQINIVAPPNGIDHRNLAWKGGVLLSKLDACQDLWIRTGDWELFGMRAIKERTTCCL